VKGEGVGVVVGVEVGVEVCMISCPEELVAAHSPLARPYGEIEVEGEGEEAGADGYFRRILSSFRCDNRREQPPTPSGLVGSIASFSSILCVAKGIRILR